MCGRFVLSRQAFDEVSHVARIPDYVQQELNFSEIFPSQKSLVLVGHDDELVGEAKLFGFYSDYFKKRIINARAKGITSKWMFRHALRKDRALIPCSGFFEWSPSKIKTLFFKEHQPVLYMAGLVIDDGFVIITTDANRSVEDVHHRMPLILPFDQAKEWVLDGNRINELLEWRPEMLDRESLTLF